VKSLAVILTLALPAAAAFAQADSTQGKEPQNRPEDAGVCRFVDADGDGFNDLAPDHDGDGIPNGLDPDWVKPENGDGEMNRFADQYGEMLRMFFGGSELAGHVEAGIGYGPGDGTGEGVGPGDGSGFGPGDDSGDTGTGDAVQERRQGRR